VREELRLDVVEDDCVISEQLLVALGESVAKLGFVSRVEPNENRLIVLFDLVLVFVAESSVQRIARIASALR
jgi:hypothetical protein